MRRFCLLLCIFLSGCTAFQADQLPPVDWSDRATRLKLIDTWEFSGRLGVKDLIAGDGTQANLRWRQAGAASTLRLSGPFGAGASEIYLNPQSLRVIDGDGERTIEYTGSDAAERFLFDQLGWSFPAQSTRYWLLGLPHPDAPARQVFDADGMLAELDQYGWQIRYERFGLQDELQMPTRLVMQSAKARLRIVISKWQIPTAGL